MTMNILKEIKLEEMVPKTGKIILKPNLVVAKPASSGATTHSEMIAATIEYLQNHGFNDLLIAEGSWVGDYTGDAFQADGLNAVSRKYGVPTMDLKKDRFVEVTAKGITMQVSKTVMECGYLISYPVIKGHCQTTFTCALKNMKGVLSDGSKRRFHSLGLHKPIAALNTIKCADLVLADGICGDLDFEEGGNPVFAGRIVAAQDSVLMDAFGASLLGFPLEDIPYITMAEQFGVGTTDLSKAAIHTVGETSAAPMPPASRKVRELARHCTPDSACSACYASLIHALARLEEEGLLRRLKNQLYIGQGYRGRNLDEIGIGNCCAKFAKHVPGCPPSAADILRMLEEEIK
jgi:uncharacterized protein (DUF362 family)